MKVFASAISSILNEDAKEYISMWVFVLTPMFLLLALAGLGVFVYSISQQKDVCWDVREISEKAVKINACTGEIESIEGFGAGGEDGKLR